MKRIFIPVMIAAVLSGSSVTQVFAHSETGHLYAETTGDADDYGRLVNVLTEDFSLFTAGTEETPAADALTTDWGGSFDSGKVHTPGWGGQKVHEAGGTAFVESSGMLWTPNVDMTDAVDYRFYVKFRARLANGATSGTPSVTMGYNNPVYGEPLSADWKEYNIPFSGNYSGTYLTFKATGAWLIDDIVIDKVLPYLDTPLQPRFSDYSVNSFKASWNPVEGASGYKLSVYSYDTSGQQVPFITDQLVEGTSYVVTGLPVIEGFFYFTVKAVDGDGNESRPTEEVCVEALETPGDIHLTDVSGTGFAAAWSPVAGAKYYDVWLYRETTATADGPADLFNTDFSFVSANDEISNSTIIYNEMAGWIIYQPMVADGQLGLDGFASPFSTYYATMESPAMNMSRDGGNVEVSMTVKAASGSAVSVSLYTKNEEGVYPAYPESYERFTDINANGYETRTFTLTGGGEISSLLFKVDDWGDVWFDDLRITQNVMAGDAVAAPIYSALVEEPEIAFGGLDLTGDLKYYFVVRAVGDVNSTKTDFVYSDYSEKVYVDKNTHIPDGIEGMTAEADAKVTAANGVISITNPSGMDVAVYDLAGRLIHSDSNAGTFTRVEVGGSGIYIVRVGNKSFKVVIG